MLVYPGQRSIPVAEGNVDRTVRSDNRMRALVLVAGIGIRLPAANRADRRVGPADLDAF